MWKNGVLVLVFHVLSANCINIEGQLTVIKKDCYERLAYGEKLSPTQTYRRFDHNSVAKCEQECTEEKDKCRAYSIGIGTKGNGTCLLGQQTIKETANLKPIGTIHDQDYDLYIKKINCQIVLEPPHPLNHYGNLPAHSNTNNHYQHPPVHSGQQTSDQGVIQTLVSIASGPNSVLHPNLDILVSGDSLGGISHGYQGNHPAQPYLPEFQADPRPPRPPNFVPFENSGGAYTVDRRKYESSLSSFESESFGFGMEKPINYYDHYSRPDSDYRNRYASVIPHPDDYQRPERDYLQRRPAGYVYPHPSDVPGTRPSTSFRPPIATKPATQLTNHYAGGQFHSVTQSVSQNGVQVTSIVTELPNACFRRTMAGSRTVRSLVRKLAICETSEQCQRECGEERQFNCEGFNYRLDATGQGKGTCELLDVPLSRLDLHREIVADSMYDLYTRDRNCGQHNYYPRGDYGGGYGYGNGKKDWSSYDRKPTDLGRPLRPIDRWDDDYVNPPPRLPPPRPPPSIPSDYDNRRGDSYHHSHESHSSHSHHHNEHTVDRYDYRPGIPYRPSGGVPYLPDHPKRVPVIIRLDYGSEDGNRLPALDKKPSRWQYGHNYNRYDIPRRNYYIPTRPPKQPVPEEWGQYGGSYGTGQAVVEYKGYGKTDSYDYWGFDRFQNDKPPNYRPEGAYLPLPPGRYHSSGGELDNAILPPQPQRPHSNSGRDECSLRSASGFRLHKEVVRKILTVADIYECELLCVVEKRFLCASYAFRYTSPRAPIDNCYLSARNYKELDYYTDLEPDREFDVYTMNNRQTCVDPHNFLGRDESDCFWRVRSGQRLHESAVCDSLTVKSIVDCQIECLKSYRFVCRAYSFRYGSPVIGGAIDNCQLTDWPLHELDPEHHFVAEVGFEIYNRASYGHGCEPNYFEHGGQKSGGASDPGTKIDQRCYQGFGSGSKLLQEATRKRLDVPTELDCKQECSRARESTGFSCTTLSFQAQGPKTGPNCLLSDIMQRDLLPNVDFIHDPNTWLFSWDNSNPECVDAAFKPGHQAGNALTPSGNRGIDNLNPLDVWKVYSVSGWPCRSGTKCQENTKAGFWYCELEGGGKDSWDYCCSPDHHCGLSNGYSYSWCYVGPSKTQWRKCSDQYYPYGHGVDRFDGNRRPWDSSGGLPPPPHSSGFRPDRPDAPAPPPAYQSHEYEQDFNDEFLNPPKPGGFGPPKRWPVAYLHKELPPNVTSSFQDKQGRSSEPKPDSSRAIQSLIDTIQKNENRSQEALIMTVVPISVSNMEDQHEVNKTQPTRLPTARSLSPDEGNRRPSGYRRGVVTRTNSTANNNSSYRRS